MHLTFYLSTVQWEQVTAITACTGLLGTVLIWAVGSIVDKKLTGFLVRLNGTYLRKELAEAKFKAIDERFDYIAEHGSRSNHSILGHS